jgi:hypothetical protein
VTGRAGGEGAVSEREMKTFAEFWPFYVREHSRPGTRLLHAAGTVTSTLILVFVVTKVFRPDEISGLGIGGPAGGDLYFDTAPGYMPTSRYVADIFRPARRGAGNGEHGFYPHRTKMKAVFFMAGPGVRRNLTVPGVRQIDIAPTLARLLGIPAPRDARGHVVGEALVD